MRDYSSEYQSQRIFDRFLWWMFILSGMIALLIITFVWMKVAGDPFVKSLYWSVQTFTTVGYGVGFQTWDTIQQIVCILWMITSVIYWNCIITIIASAVTERFLSRL